MRRLSRRARRWLALVLCLAVAASVAGLVLSLRGESRARPAAAPGSSGPGTPAASPSQQPGSTQAQADLSKMQALLNTGSVSAQAALLVPPFQFAQGSGPVFPAGTAVRIKPETLRPDGRQFGLVEASLSGGKTATLGLYAVQGHWHLCSVTTGSAQTSAKIISTPGGPPGVQLMSATANHIPTKAEISTGTPVIMIHGVFGDTSYFGSDSLPGSMFASVHSIRRPDERVRATWVSAWDYSATNGEWTDVNGPPFAAYIRQVAQVSRAAGGPGQVIVVGYSMGGLFTRWAATVGGEDGQSKSKNKDIAEVITIGTPNTGSFEADFPSWVHEIICKTPKSVQEHIPYMSEFCADFTAAAGLSAFGPKIAALPELPSDIPLHAIAGEMTILMPLGNAMVTISLAAMRSCPHHRRCTSGPREARVRSPRSGAAQGCPISRSGTAPC